MKLKSLIIGLALTSGSLLANTVTLLDTPYDGNLSGGEFKAVTSNHGTFYTFCLERHINVSLNTQYTYTIDTRALSGGNDAHDPVGAGPAGDPLSKGTSWLYTRFALGNLVDSDGVGNYNDNHDYNAGLLQQAFWALEDEVGYENYSNYYVNLVQGIFSGAAKDTTVATNVKVMNIWGINGQDKQSQLYLVPDSGMTVALLGLGVLSLIAFRRKA
jgi:hypothetical protein